MPEYFAGAKNVYIGIIAKIREESVHFDEVLEYDGLSWDTNLGPQSNRVVPKVKVPLYDVLTFPDKELLERCIPIFPLGSKAENIDFFWYDLNDVVVVLYNEPTGYPIIIGAVPYFIKDLVKNFLFPQSGRLIKIGDSVIKINEIGISIGKGDYILLSISNDGIKLYTSYEPAITVGENNITTTLPVDFPKASATELYSTGLSNDLNKLSINKVEAEISAINLLQAIENMTQAIVNLTNEIVRLNATIKEKANITCETPLSEKGGITIQKSDNSNPEQLSKAKTLKQQLDLFKQWAKTHTHPTSGAPPSSPPPDFTEDWFSELIETD